ncbi:MAG TPA: carbamoyltransferase C-terminal domain-containing protein [Opitutaceae bacterium]|nr:carbamoyltransferase C-terminal domain-containing protein [Opitutaceae bacterium]
MTSQYDAVIGVWDGHDAGAALVVNGKVELALNEERLSGRKLDVGMPNRAIKAMRDLAGGRNVAWAVTTSDFAKTLTRTFPVMKENYYALRRRLVPPGPFHALKLRSKYSLTQWPTNRSLRTWARLHFASKLGVPKQDVYVVDHHAAHAASAAFWPAWDGSANIITLDGIGDGESGSIWEWSETTRKLRKLVSIPGRASFGLFFEHVTNELQMRPLEDEGKVMALATFAAEIPNTINPFLKWFSLEKNSDGLPKLSCAIKPSAMAKAVADVIYCTPREQVCRMAQQTLEYFVPRIFEMTAAATGCGRFGYSGGVASNIKVNRLIRATAGIADLKVCPAMGDGGLALGAALYAWNDLTESRPASFEDFRLGTDHGDLAEGVEKLPQVNSAKIEFPKDIPFAVAQLVAAGEVVMWAQGRMELGARALGARSIIARADSITARDDLNLRLKRRVWFQPFCPSMLLSEAPRLLADFRSDSDINLHMTAGFMTTQEGRIALAGAIGPDASCRPQMVRDDANERWARMLQHVKRLTGTGAVINTSLNMHGKPMADNAAGVVEAWVESGVKYLALGSALLSKLS